MGRKSKRRRRKNSSKSYTPLRVMLYTNYEDANPSHTLMCHSVQEGRYGFWIKHSKNGNLSFYDHIAYAIVEELRYT